MWLFCYLIVEIITLFANRTINISFTLYKTKFTIIDNQLQLLNKSGLLNTLRSYETTSRCPVLSCTSLTLGDDLVHFPTFLAKYLESSLFCYIFAT